MLRVGGGHRDRTPDGVLLESRLTNKEVAGKIRKLLVPKGQQGALVVMPASFPPVTTRPGRIVLFTSFMAAGLVPPFSTFLHLSPNSVVVLAVFAHFCEMFVGVAPLVTLLRHFFALRSGRKKRGYSTADVAGCCNLRLRNGMGE